MYSFVTEENTIGISSPIQKFPACSSTFRNERKSRKAYLENVEQSLQWGEGHIFKEQFPIRLWLNNCGDEGVALGK